MERKTILIAGKNDDSNEMFKKFLNRDFSSYNYEVYRDKRSLKKRLKRNTKGIAFVIIEESDQGILGSKIAKKYADKLKIPFVFYSPEDKFFEDKTLGEGHFFYPENLVQTFDFLKKYLKNKNN